MAKIRTNTHEVLTNFCGNCGIILAKYLDIGDHCPKCKEVIEP
jgi:ribosomal protein S27AE